MRSALSCSALLCCCLLVAVASAQADPYQVYATLQFKKGKALNKLPGAKDLKPPRLVRSTTVHMSAARLQVRKEGEGSPGLVLGGGRACCVDGGWRRAALYTVSPQ